MIDFKKVIQEKILQLELGLEPDEVLATIETPPDPKMGDFAFPTFRLAKTFRKAPNLIAQELQAKISTDEYLKEVRAVGPYLNFFIDPTAYATVVFEEGKKEKFGASEMGKGKNVVIDYSSTNIAKPFHIGHLRSTAIGNAIKNILRYEGYHTIGENYLGDYGTQFGMLISAYLKWGKEDEIKKDPITKLLELYVRYNKEAKDDETLMDEARSWFERLEKKDEKAVQLWSWFKEISLGEFQRVYDLLGVTFDSYNGEAFHSQFIDDVLRELQEKNLLEESEGAMIINLEKENLPPVLIQKSNGSSTYITRDIATAEYRKKTYDFYKNLYVVASQQRLHFEQLRATLSKMGYDWAKDCEHIQFGMISMKDGAMKTREGKVIFLEDVLNRAIEKTKTIIDERNSGLENKEEVAKDVGVGAVIFQDLFNNRIKDYVFDWDQVLNFDGETGPYTQYTYARSSSILKKGDFSLDLPTDVHVLKEEEEFAILKHLYQFESVLEQAALKFEPSLVTRYTVELAKLFNRFYGKCPINSSEEILKNTRLYLTYIVNKVLKTGLHLLGIKAPERM